MWLLKVKEKLDNNEYKYREQFKQDVILIFENARVYNSKDTIFFKFADILQAYAEPYLEKLKETKADIEVRKRRQQQKGTAELEA